MPYYSQSEFAKLIGKSNAYVSTYISRGKILKSGDVIDSTVQKNIDIMMKLGVDVDAINGATTKRPTKPPTVTKKPQETKKENSKKIDISPPPPENTGGQYQLDLDKKEAELEFKQVQTRIKLIEEERLRGELIPVDLVSEMISQLSRSIITTYKDSMDKFLIEVSHRKKMSDKDTAELKGLMVEQINKAHDNAITEAIKELKDVSPKVKSNE